MDNFENSNIFFRGSVNLSENTYYIQYQSKATKIFTKIFQTEMPYFRYFIKNFILEEFNCDSWKVV